MGTYSGYGQQADDQIAALQAQVADLQAQLDALKPPPDPQPVDTAWLSGASGAGVASGEFGAWRGSPVQVATYWCGDPAQWNVLPGEEYGSWTGPICACIGPTPWPGWAAMANGSYDGWWKQTAQTIQTNRAGKGQVFVAPFYEYNGTWMPWSVSSGDVANFKAAWARLAPIVRAAIPGVKLVCPPAIAAGVPSGMRPDPKHYDCGGGTCYNAWPWEASGATWLQRMETERAALAAIGKPMFVTEWANPAKDSGGAGGGDAPGFIQGAHDYFAAHAGTGAGQILGETYFNVSDGYDGEYYVWDGGPNQSQPQAAAKYAQLF